MHQLRFRRLLAHSSVAALAMLTVGLTACGSTSGGGSANKDLILASELPVSGGDAGNGIPTQNGVELAVTKNADLGGGYKLTFLAKDDVSASLGKHDAKTGQANVTQLVANNKVMAVVGPFNSSVAGAEIPVIQGATLTLISPSNTNPGLTIKDYADANGFNYDLLHPAGKPNAYFRVPGNDVVQGKLDADIALAPAPGAAAKTVFLVDDNEAYGKGLADQFEKEFTAKGGHVLGTRQSIDPKQNSTFPSVAANIASLKPDLVFFGGTTTGGGGALKQAVAATGADGAKIPWEGGDGIGADPDWLTEGGDAAINTFATVAAPDVASLGAANTIAATFISDYKTKYGKDPLPYSAMAYDGAMIEITAMKNVIAAGNPVTRANVRDAVAKIQYDGVTGKISFDANGDNAGTKVYSVWLCKKGADGKPAWVFVQDVTASA